MTWRVVLSRKQRQIYRVGTDLLERGLLFSRSVDDIAEQIGVSKVTLYKYFGSRDGLVEALLLRYYRDIFEEARSSGRGQERLAALFGGEVQKSRLDVDAVRTVFRTGSAEFHGALDGLQQDALALLGETFGECQEEGLFQRLTFEDFLLVLKIYIDGVTANLEHVDVARAFSLLCAVGR